MGFVYSVKSKESEKNIMAYTILTSPYILKIHSHKNTFNKHNIKTFYERNLNSRTVTESTMVIGYLF